MQRFYFLLFCCLLSYSAWAQPERDFPDDEQIDTTNIERVDDPSQMRQRKPLKVDNLFIGMTFSLFFGNTIFVEGSPYVGYLLGDYIGLGVGGTYIYIARFNGTQYIGDNIYGGRVFANLRPLPQVPSLRSLYIRAEGEYLNRAEFRNGRTIRNFVPAVNLGLGYNTAFDNGFGFTMEFLVNALWFEQVNTGQQPVYDSPWQYRLGIYYAFWCRLNMK